MKTKKYSLAYWVKQNTRFVSQPETVLLDAIKTYAECGEHPALAFTGTPLELANALYIEWRKKPGAYPGLFPTPLDVALRAAQLLELQPGQRVLDVGSGLGNLSWAVRECGGVPIGVEVQPWAQQVNQALGLGAVCADFLDGYRPPEFDAVIVNPPYGRVYGHADAALDFMLRIAGLSPSGVRVAAILPSGFMDEGKARKAYAEMRRFFHVIKQEPLPPDTFKPLTTTPTTLYLLQVVKAGWLNDPQSDASQSEPADVGQVERAATDTSEALIEPDIPTLLARIDQAQADVRAALKPMREPPHLPDGRLRAEMPEELVEICERQHVLDYRFMRSNSDHPAFEDDEVMIRGTQLDAGQWRWDALYLSDGAALEIDLWREGDDHETINGPDAIAALAALKYHLSAWGIEPDIWLSPDPLPSGLPRAPIPYDLYRRRAARYVLWHSPEPQARYELWEDNGLRLIKMPDDAWWAYYLDADNQELPIPWGKAPDPVGQDFSLTGDTAEECAALLQEHFEAWGCPTLITFCEEPFKKQRTGAAADEFLRSIPTFGVTWPPLPDGRQRAALPDGLRERLKGNAVHTFQFRRLNEQPAFVTASDLRLVGEKLDSGQWKWIAQDGAVKIARHDKAGSIEFIEGATALEALAALREHLRAWEVKAQLVIKPRDAWQADEIALLIEELDRQPILVDDPSLGILTPHDLAAHAEHMGYGLFKLGTDKYTIHFDGGGGLRCFPGGHGWSPVEVKRGTFPYDADGVRKTLQAWHVELGAQSETDDDAARPVVEVAQSVEPLTQSPINPIEAQQLLAQAEKLYSGALLATGPKVKGLIEYSGQHWVSTGGCFGQWADLHRVVPRQDWTGEGFEKANPRGHIRRRRSTWVAWSGTKARSG